MHGVIVHVKIDSSRRKEAVKILNEVTVPRAKAIPGFVWCILVTLAAY